ncbi:DUF6691 family protein [Photobacterium damselae]|uniref:DUF6691 family protein n=1 Tax=Photobacterium damselae TaxID=38293 RepID=UPI003B680B2F
MTNQLKSILGYLVALSSGLLFGAGMMISQMVDPAKVIGFLNITGDWDPSLVFVMGGALLVFAPGYYVLVKPRQKPILTEKLSLSQLKSIDRPLVIGAMLFGIGWGVSGVCPGPALTSISSLNPTLLLFVIAMIVGIVVSQRIKK